MARTVNQEENALKRREILDAAQRLVSTLGYERMTIQDILREVGMSSGAFYHYFKSKPLVLEAMIERTQEQVELSLFPIVQDAELSALDKLRRFFETLDRTRASHEAMITELLRVWFADENAIVREKVDEAIVRRRGPLLNAIVRQGIEEGVFTTPYPDQAGGLILALTRGMGSRLPKLMLAAQQAPGEHDIIGEVVATFDAYADAIERVLGAPSASLPRLDAEQVTTWLGHK